MWVVHMFPVLCLFVVNPGSPGLEISVPASS